MDLERLNQRLKYPPTLVPTTTHSFRLERGEVAVPKATPRFSAWSDEQPSDTYNGKQVLDAGGRPAFFELAVLWALNAIGWDGVWIDSYRRCYRQGYWNCEPILKLPNMAHELIDPIRNAPGSNVGAWDVMCWRDNEVLFAECKRARKDAIRKSQVHWLEAALKCGVSVEDFLVVEWSVSPSA